ncbi:MAG TPA: hypothetical protein VGR06_02370 [Actinophytocola sp.]|uniref:hypothetical protein n=1 Tax=Actinophytocola sp. TaxID=1872138 RepID=UPI002E035B31|nr:hypothetical protein [Actinophytocola sp.]
MTGPEPPLSYPPMPSGGFTGPMPRPQAVSIAFGLVLLGIGIVVLMLVLSLVIEYDALTESMAEELAKDGPYTEGELHAATSFTAGLISVIVGVAAGLFLLFGILMRTGRNWARVVLTVLLSFGMLVSILLGALPFGLVIRFLALPLFVVCVFAVGVMFSRSAGPYFDPRARMGSWGA